MTLEQLKLTLQNIPEDRRAILGPVLLNRYNMMNSTRPISTIAEVLALEL